MELYKSIAYTLYVLNRTSFYKILNRLKEQASIERPQLLHFTNNKSIQVCVVTFCTNINYNIRKPGLYLSMFDQDNVIILGAIDQSIKLYYIAPKSLPESWPTKSAALRND